MTNDEKQQLARKFLSVLGRPDEALVKSVTVADVVWSFPGSSAISGEAHGAAAIMTRARAIAGHDVKVEIVRAVYGHEGVAMILHNTSNAGGRVLDEHLAAVFAFRGDKISRLYTYLSDVAMAEAFFA